MKINNTLKLIISIAVSELAGIIGAVFTTSSVNGWYAGIVKFFFNPQVWIFGPVWIILYFLMGISLWLIWKSDSKEKSKAIWLFLIQIALNAIWSPIFFGAQSIGNALAV